uniref:Uncharacterized protein n=1 Tax=Anopheles farauti TaxID=69004 RepID=A0A182QS47_9DIPT
MDLRTDLVHVELRKGVVVVVVALVIDLRTGVVRNVVEHAGASTAGEAGGVRVGAAFVLNTVEVTPGTSHRSKVGGWPVAGAQVKIEHGRWGRLRWGGLMMRVLAIRHRTDRLVQLEDLLRYTLATSQAQHTARFSRRLRLRTRMVVNALRLEEHRVRCMAPESDSVTIGTLGSLMSQSMPSCPPPPPPPPLELITFDCLLAESVKSKHSNALH